MSLCGPGLRRLPTGAQASVLRFLAFVLAAGRTTPPHRHVSRRRHPRGRTTAPVTLSERHALENEDRLLDLRRRGGYRNVGRFIKKENSYEVAHARWALW